MRRHEFFSLAGAAIAFPLAARGQQPVMPVIGVLNSGKEQLRPDQFDGLHRGLKEAGFVAGANVTVAYLGADDHYERLPGLAEEFVRRPVTVIAAVGGPVVALAAKAVTSTIPVVFSCLRSGQERIGCKPQPAGRQCHRKRRLHHRARRQASGVTDRTLSGCAQHRRTGQFQSPRRRGPGAGHAGGGEDRRARTDSAPRWLRESHRAFATFAERRITALLIGADGFFNNHRPLIVALAARHAMATAYAFREFVSEGGLLSYGPNLTEAYRLAGLYIGRI